VPPHEELQLRAWYESQYSGAPTDPVGRHAYSLLGKYTLVLSLYPGAPQWAVLFAEAKAPVVASVVEELEEGVIYLRRDTTGSIKDYVGQAEDDAHFLVRQQRHTARYPGSPFEFHVLDHAAPGVKLDVAEESWIRAGGGPTNQSNPNGGLSNERYQMNDADYRANGGTVPLPERKR
jgi:hypothetical protein